MVIRGSENSISFMGFCPNLIKGLLLRGLVILWLPRPFSPVNEYCGAWGLVLRVSPLHQYIMPKAADARYQQREKGVYPYLLHMPYSFKACPACYFIAINGVWYNM